ncbi:MAG TPA: site-specific integrase [Pirellulales bacterium]|jgi:integrase|nr:site-specific integrase [Pirellulales bacterium]
MPGRPRKIPSYCRHRATDQAVVRIAGTDHYLGKYGTPESYKRYQRIIAERFPSGGGYPVGEGAPSLLPGGDPTIVDLIAAYWTFAKGYYVKNGEPTSEQTSIRLAFRPLFDLYARTRARGFGPLALEAVRERMIENGITRKRINQHVGRIRRMFRWAVSKELLPVQVHQALTTLSGLRHGRTRARESRPVGPVSYEHVVAVMPFLTPPLQGMVWFQWFTACRPNEACLLRPQDVDRASKVWEYLPESHKTEHHERQRRIYIGPQGQAILTAWFDRKPDEFCFSPKDGRKAFDVVRRSRARFIRPKKNRKRPPQKQPGNRYTTASYGYAIRRACKRANVPKWSPNQLRHARSTIIRKNYGLEGSQVVLGHSKADVTQVYAERDFTLAKSIMAAIG